MPLALNKLVPYSDEPITQSSFDPQPSAAVTQPTSHQSARSFLGKVNSASSIPKGYFSNRWRKNICKTIMKSYRIRPLGRSRENINIGGNINLRFGLNLPVKIRPFFCLSTTITLVVLLVIWFHPSLHALMPIPEKLFHFFGFLIITSLFYSIPEVEDQSKVIWYWNYFNEISTGLVCFFLGGFCTEIIQLVIPWKAFSWSDLISNQLGCLAGYKLSEYLHRRYRHRLELSKFYEPLSSLREIELPSDNEEDEGIGDLQRAEIAFGGLNDRNELSNVWSDRIDGETEYFNFKEDEED
ncbi:hypothetical protein BY996DRAFT_4583578 [Phakopsora pachyrhizi]|uniref:VanZ-like domain-containing protein n=1 Tax=Phakopsora pachyrhizi TaxID=170000 RepID=A0AAV0BS08_PHAPC|nr:hypothetical protein BY996DRAFT_4583578 [Phakopsora pachyrhizi]CAH7690201.1 hypothetical protein PPACK8108_LOCUS25473 [Phakopsora pachyrhizi]